MKMLFGADQVYVFLEKIDRYLAFTNFNGFQQLINIHDISNVFVREYTFGVDYGLLLGKVDEENYDNVVGVYNAISYSDFAKNSAINFSSNVNNIKFYQPSSHHPNEKFVRSYLVYA